MNPWDTYELRPILSYDVPHLGNTLDREISEL